MKCSGSDCRVDYEDIGEPQMCDKVPPFGAVESCYTNAVAPGVWERGCFYDMNSEQQDYCEYDNIYNCHMCYGTACNYYNFALK